MSKGRQVICLLAISLILCIRRPYAQDTGVPRLTATPSPTSSHSAAPLGMCLEFGLALAIRNLRRPCARHKPSLKLAASLRQRGLRGTRYLGRDQPQRRQSAGMG